jgi:hypothetical protein
LRPGLLSTGVGASDRTRRVNAAARGGADRIAVLLTDHTDWAEIRELVTESYRILAPKKLTALLD